MESIEEMREYKPDDFPYSEQDLQRIQASSQVIQLVTHSSFRARAVSLIVGSCLAELTNGSLLDEPVWQWHDGVLPWNGRATKSKISNRNSKQTSDLESCNRVVACEIQLRYDAQPWGCI